LIQITLCSSFLVVELVVINFKEEGVPQEFTWDLFVNSHYLANRVFMQQHFVETLVVEGGVEVEDGLH